MKRINSINICGIDYTIVYLTDVAKVEGAGNNDGIINYSNQEIRIYESGQNQQEMQITLIHEILHAISHAYGLKTLKDKHEELDTIAHAIFDTFTRNGLFSEATE